MNPSSQSDNFSFALNHSLMERFIVLRLDEIKKRFTELLNKKALNPSDEAEIRDAIYLVFSILGKEIEKNDVDKNPDLERFVGVPIIFNDIVRLAVAQENPITTYTKYKTCISSPDAALQYFLYKLGYLKFESKKAQLKGEQSKTNDNGEFLDITFGNVEYFINRRIRRLYQKNNDAKIITQIVTQLKDDRNSESHNAFYTSPEEYWERLINLIYDYIAIAFFLTRYFKCAQNQNTKVKEDNSYDLRAAREKIQEIVTEAKKINVRFQFEKKDEAQKLSIRVGNEHIGNIGRAPETLTENGITYCYYDTILKRNTTYTLQSIVSKSIFGNPLPLSTDILFDGAVVLLEMPTKENSIRCPEIKTIIANSTGLIEDSEHRAVIEKLLARNIGDDSLRSKLRVILMLDKGKKEEIINEFINQSHNIDNLSDKDFKKFIESKSNDILETIDRHFESLNTSLKNGQDELKGFIANAISQIDLRSILDSNAKLGDEVRNLASEITKWQEIQEKIGKRNADEARKMYDCLKDNAEKSNQTITDLSQIIKSQNGYWNEVLSKLTAIATDVTTILTNQIIIVSTAILCLIILAFGSWSYYLLRTSSNALVTHSKWRSEIAYNTFGNKDVAYERATYLESIKDYPEAAKWYMMARDRYADILKDNPADSVRALRMAQMLMRGKGGIIDTEGAEAYAKMAKRFDIEAYLAALNGNPGKAITLTNSRPSDSDYYSLAESASYLLYPHIKWDSIKIIEANHFIDSLAVTSNASQQEAMQINILLRNSGLRSGDDFVSKWSISPSILDALYTAIAADREYNDLFAQKFLISRFAQLGLQSKSNEYRRKAQINGAKIDLALDIAQNGQTQDDPLALIYQVTQNSKHGHNYYSETGKLLKEAESLSHRSIQNSIPLDSFYRFWMSCALKAEDLPDVESILPILTSSLSDTEKLATAEYIMAIKYWGGTSVEKDSVKSMEYLQKAYSKNLPDAVTAYLILQDKNGISRDLIGHARDNFAKNKTPLVRYILSRYNHIPSSVAVSLATYASEDADIMAHILRDVVDFNKLTPDLLATYYSNINWALANTPLSNSTSYLLGRLAEISFLLGKENQTQGFLSLALDINYKQCYASLFNISEIARKMGNLPVAMEYANRFSALYFQENGRVLDETNRSNVVTHFNLLYPEILETVNHELNYDFTKGTSIMIEEGFNRNRDFASYNSVVSKLQIDLPTMDRFAFPVTMKYFE